MGEGWRSHGSRCPPVCSGVALSVFKGDKWWKHTCANVLISLPFVALATRAHTQLHAATVSHRTSPPPLPPHRKIGKCQFLFFQTAAALRLVVFVEERRGGYPFLRSCFKKKCVFSHERESLWQQWEKFGWWGGWVLEAEGWRLGSWCWVLGGLSKAFLRWRPSRTGK